MRSTRSREGLEQAERRETAEENCRDRTRKVVTREDKGFALRLSTMPSKLKKKLSVLSTHSLTHSLPRHT